ncbi:MAG: DUF1501 domain-containing protein [Gemmataceae bacterium]|nr:DUF1501 domain-containing protein [Gemmataceae bacterium]MCI0743029.1 DUF1501 domain-containing protein [Gemmataceae bacterium]
MTRQAFPRRRFLAASAVGALSLFWSDWRRAQAIQPAGRAKARSVILIFNCGAPSHIDLFDMKPDAPDNIRGQFHPVATNVPGIRFSELMPHLARHADKLAIVRSLQHRQTQHNTGMYWSIVGRPYRIDSTLINPSRSDYPSFGTLVGWLAQRDGYASALPPYVITPSPHCDSSAYITPGQYGSCLGARFDPLVLNADPNAPGFRVANIGLTEGVTAARMQERRGLLERMDGIGRVRYGADFDVNQNKAFTLASAAEVQRAFDLSDEPAQVRERYGRHSWGQSHLLARRLIERGVRFVTTVNGPSITWDTHENNFVRLQTSLAPRMEQAYAALLEDLADRGLLDETLVVWMGDFGRTPLINRTAGRDHWPQCYTMVLAGGGVRGGQLIGESDAHGAYPKSSPLSPADIHASVFTLLGYDPHGIHYLSPEGRPFPLSEGQAIRELVS